MSDELAALRRDFMPADLLPLLDAAGFDAGVAVQAREVEEETDFLLGLAAGPERLMIGSDWPVCTLAADYERAMAVVLEWSNALSGSERAALLGGNCARFYGLDTVVRA